MISVYKLKPKFQKFIQPLLSNLRKNGITPNQLTLFSVFFSIGIGFLIGYEFQHKWFLIIVPIGLLIRMMMNALDGMMARQFNLQSNTGEILNELGDVISDVVIIFPLVFIGGINVYLVLFFVFMTMINEFAGLLGKVVGKERRYDGPMGKSDRALFVGIFCLTYYFWPDLSLYSNYVFGLVCVLIIWSTFIRLKKAIE